MRSAQCLLEHYFFILWNGEDTFATPFTISATNCYTMKEPLSANKARGEQLNTKSKQLHATVATTLFVF